MSRLTRARADYTTAESALYRLRDELAAERALYPHHVFTDDEVEKLARHRPTDTLALDRIALPVRKVQQYGARIVDAIAHALRQSASQPLA